MRWSARFAAAVSLLAFALPLRAQPEAPENRLSQWFDQLGNPAPDEAFGRYLARAASLQHGVAYDREAPPPGPEPLRIKLDAFECVSFIESALAVARCGWDGRPTRDCFETELERSRYREGRRGDYASRLHYFVDWIDDNDRRGRLENLTPTLGGEPVQKPFFHITQRVLAHAPLADDERRDLERALTSTETKLSETPHLVLDRNSAPDALDRLEDGDLIAFVRERPGLLVHHAGFVYRVDGSPRLLHASSFHDRVVITVEDVSDYLLRRPERRGVIVARPVAPSARD